MQGVTEEAKQTEIRCPICHKEQATKYEITDLEEKKGSWYSCFCGCVFRAEPIDKTVFDEAYKKSWEDKKGVDIRADYLFRTYLPLIEEVIYGRKFLDVGFTVPNNIENLTKRGWVATGIDLLPNDHIQGDFEEFEFGDKFDMILMSGVLESMNNPIDALVKAYDMLNQNGILFLVHPAPELINYVGLAGFGHWDNARTKTFLSEKELKHLALGLGFEVLLNRLNFSQRFLTWNNRHMILQRKYG